VRFGLLVEKSLETVLFRARWLLAPFYLGLIVTLVMLLIVFVKDMAATIPNMLKLDEEAVIMQVLTLIDLSLAGNLVIIVVFSGYENFISRIDTAGDDERPSWMGTLDFSGLKMKLIASIVAISVISLLRAFMNVLETHVPFDRDKLFWLIMLHLTFLASGVFFALMDWIATVTAARVKDLVVRSEAH
jgi:uncharacterized protein (TIGR00645 family)